MFIRKTVRKYKDRTYTAYLLVETISTPQGPRQRTICSLGDLSPGPKKKWLNLMEQVEATLQGQLALDERDPLVEAIAEKVRSAQPVRGSAEILLTRVEDAFRDLKSPLSERPIFHQLEHRVETHIFLCVLAYHLLISIEKSFLEQGIHTSWATLRQHLATHQVVTAVLPASDGGLLKIRNATKPEAQHRQIYDVLKIPYDVMVPLNVWLPTQDSD